MTGTVRIDCFPESAERYSSPYVVVAIDVIRATTTATTAVGAGRRVFPVQTCDEALVLASTLDNPLLVGELGGNMPYGFDLTNSPAQIAVRTDTSRPMILVSSSGTQLIATAAGVSDAVYLACLRNYTAVAEHLAGRHRHIAVIGAGTRGAFRREDQIGCARVAERLVGLGYRPEDRQTEEYICQWRDASLETIRDGQSAQYLRRSGQEDDLEFVLAHVDDLSIVPRLVNGELMDAAMLVDAVAVAGAGPVFERESLE
ncbi:MAG TPA: 2-phosphosulfolactate phosphatase [Vicinamibacterales bacterium]|nr:2-phosphosulfolactate phosphatase [Vicinamibacterales bacterium]